VAGRIVESGTPGELITALQGRVWQTSIDKSDLEGARQRYAVIATRLRAGQTVIRVMSEEAGLAPGAAFEPVETGLEDVYFATLHRLRSASAMGSRQADGQAQAPSTASAA